MRFHLLEPAGHLWADLGSSAPKSQQPHPPGSPCLRWLPLAFENTRPRDWIPGWMPGVWLNSGRIPGREVRIESLGLVFPETMWVYAGQNLVKDRSKCAIGCMNLLDTLELILDWAVTTRICIASLHLTVRWSPSAGLKKQCLNDFCARTPSPLLRKDCWSKHVSLWTLGKATVNWNNWWKISNVPVSRLDCALCVDTFWAEQEQAGSICWTLRPAFRFVLISRCR